MLYVMTNSQTGKNQTHFTGITCLFYTVHIQFISERKVYVFHFQHHPVSCLHTCIIEPGFLLVKTTICKSSFFYLKHVK
jgi:hypothetical protein